MVNIFAREITDDLTGLVRQLDEVVGQNGDMAGFFVLLTDDPDAAEAKLKDLASKHNIRNIPLTVFPGVAGPPSYKLSADADVTVLMWSRSVVKANHAFAKGGLDGDAIAKVVANAKSLPN